ncbi:hypothetical protein F4813DRAFT_349714 [Daldinia decipiens]|uniref:uncharacterized protein n=1 Tax=Daldinia decipiens TaxID=326647 RepID=UPI0020C509C1|nr:uncharacterized protein F4813DRAFT_349714 [Daldinia decipiens]KAI1660370.1 hypothetical protein F4813DRAFT_349714 [Daldinia decipiens]
MSIPPQLIRVKRKATEEAPVSFLRVQENKRHRSEAFVYQRQQEQANSAENIPSESHKPIIHTSHPHSKTPAFQSPKTSDTIVHDGSSDNETASESSKSTSPVDAPSEPRRFHMSRKDIMLAAASQPGRPHGGISKKRSAPALFVERKIKRISSRPLEKFQAITNAASQIPGPAPAASEDMEIDKPESRKLKKPGVAKLAKKQDGEKYKADLPQSITQRWNVDIDKLTAELDAYTMEQIGLNLQKAEEEKQRSILSQHRFKPKPIKRYAERHPGEMQASVDKDTMDTDVDISDSDDSDYIIETYERVPASKMGEHVPPHSVGLLVFDGEPDMEHFYGEDDNSEDEWAEDEEDENAENYYAADYPDEEVASDDEFDKNPYSFRTGNASDLEEYDLDEDDGDAAFTDKDEASRFAAYISRPQDRFMANQL